MSCCLNKVLLRFVLSISTNKEMHSYLYHIRVEIHQKRQFLHVSRFFMQTPSVATHSHSKLVTYRRLVMCPSRHIQVSARYPFWRHRTTHKRLRYSSVLSRLHKSPNSLCNTRADKVSLVAKHIQDRMCQRKLSLTARTEYKDTVKPMIPLHILHLFFICFSVESY